MEIKGGNTNMKDQVRISSQDPILENHKAYGQILLPGLAYIDLMYQMFREKGYDYNRLELRNLSIYQPLVVAQGQNMLLTIEYDDSRAEQWKIKVTGQEKAGAGEKPYMTAEMHVVHQVTFGEKLDVASVKKDASHVVDLEERYAQCRTRGLVHTGILKAEGSIYESQEYTLMELALHAQALHGASDFIFHPTLIDSSAIGSGGLFSADPEDKSLFLPLYYESFSACAPLQTDCLALIRQSSRRHKKELIYQTIEFYTSSGVKIAELKNYANKLVRNPSAIISTENEILPDGATDRPVLKTTSTQAYEITSQSPDVSEAGKSMEPFLRKLISDQLQKPWQEIDVNMGYYEMGLDSPGLLKVVQQIEKKTGAALSPTLLFEFTTIAELAKHLGAQNGEVSAQTEEDTRSFPEGNGAPESASASLVKHVELFLKKLLAEQLQKPLQNIETETGYYEMGLDSAGLLKIVQKLEQKIGESLSPTLLFEYTNIAELAGYLNKEYGSRFGNTASQEGAASGNKNISEAKKAKSVPVFSEPESVRSSSEVTGANENIAIIGIAGRYPEAKNLDEFWENLKTGKDCIREIPLSRWDWRMLDAIKSPSGKNMSRWGGFIEEADRFDPLFFNISPRDAEVMDPQERLFLEVCWEAIETAGYTPQNLVKPQGPNNRRKVGVFAGVMHNDYGLIGGEALARGAAFPLSVNYAPIANRVSYVCNFHGPSMAVDTVCSSSLTAVHLALESIRRGECETALAGGVNLSLHPAKYMTYGVMDMHASDGYCHTFGKGGDGYVSAEGVGAVLLKPVQKAIEDGDHIYAVIKGSSINHVGTVSGFTVPSPVAHADMIADCIEKTGIDPRTISYVEAHGTGTSLGDPIEIQGLVKAFRRFTGDRQFCSIGSVKSNMGHAESAAGISGLTKVILQLHHKTLVPSLHSAELNPYIDFSQSPFYVQQETQDWKQPVVDATSHPRRAGLSSFGAYGSNAHLILEEYIPGNVTVDPEFQPVSGPQMVVLSAKNKERLDEYAQKLLTFVRRMLEGGKAVNMKALAFTLQSGRVAMEERLGIIASSAGELAEKLEGFLKGKREEEEIFYGQIKRNKEALAALAGDDDTFQVIEAWKRKGKYSKLLDLWVKGLNIDWNTLFRNEKPERIALPTYPFARERYWIPEVANGMAGEALADKASYIHPLLHRNNSDFSDVRFTSLFSGKELLVKDYMLAGENMLSPSVYPEMAIAAFGAVNKGISAEPVTLRNLVWGHPHSFTDSSGEVHMRLLQGKPGENSYEVYTESVDAAMSAEFIHHQGEVMGGEGQLPAAQDLNYLKSHCGKYTFTAEHYYSLLERLGWNYGSEYKILQTINTGEKQLLAQLRLPSVLSENSALYTLQPTLMEAVFQAATGLIKSEDFRSGQFQEGYPLLPFALQELKLYGKCDQVLWIWARYSELNNADDKDTFIDVDLCDAQGSICACIKGLLFREVRSKIKSGETVESTGTVLFQPEWKKAVLTDKPVAADLTQSVVLLAGVPAHSTGWHDLKQMLKAEVLEVSETGERFSGYAGQVFSRIKNILEEKPREKILIQVVGIDEGDNLLLTGLSGLFKTAQQENPRVMGQLILLPSGVSADLMCKQVKASRQCPQDVVVRYSVSGERTVLSWKEVAAAAALGAAPWKNEGVYLITGGLGGLGRIFASEIVRKSRKPGIILTGRSPLSADKETILQELQQTGALVKYIQADVSHKEQADSLIRNIVREHGTLNGIIHAAGINRDNFILKKSLREFGEVLSAKIDGTVNLDRAAKDIPLDFFILFSSIAGAIGNLGQADYATANAFMDSYAAFRNGLVQAKERSGQTLSMNWPLWKEGGMGVDAATAAVMKENTGMVPMGTETGIRALYQGLSSGQSQLLVIEGIPGIARRTILDTAAAPAGQVKEVKPAGAPDLSLLNEKTTEQLRLLFGSTIKLPVSQVDAQEPLESYGIDSIIITQLNRKLGEQFGEISKTLFFEHRTLGALAAHFVQEYPQKCQEWTGLKEKPEEEKTVKASLAAGLENDFPVLISLKHRKREESATPNPPDNSYKHEPVAIVGMSGRFPHAASMEEFWQNLVSGRDCITEIPEERWATEGFYHPDPEEAIAQGKSYSKWGGFIQGFAEFDPLFFNISPREAKVIDPQERLFLQATWEALEDAGFTREHLEKKYDRKVGVFAGITKTGFDLFGPGLWQEGMHMYPHTSFSSLANRVSFFLNLRGPSMPVDTMCSSSLVAIHEACKSLWNGECQVAIAGGVNVYLHPSSYVWLCSMKMLSGDGQCKSFGKGGNGFVPGEGVGAFILKPLSKAVQDGDNIHAVIKGTSVNHGGRTHGYTVPNPNAQGDVILEAIEKAGIHARTITYLEAHGTGTELGDPIEITGLTQAFRKHTTEQGFCAIGSAKSNIGHLEAAAATAGLAKVILQMKHAKLVPTLHARQLNPNIQFDKTPFKVQQQLAGWQRPLLSLDGVQKEYPRRAGLSSFGAGGTNAHIILEEYIPDNVTATSSRSVHPVVAVLSARSRKQLADYAQKLLHYTKKVINSEITASLEDMAYTLQTGREPMEERAAIVAGTWKELAEGLQKFTDGAAGSANVFYGKVEKGVEASFRPDAADRQVMEQNVSLSEPFVLADLWVKGTAPHWDTLYKESRPDRISLPTYPFERKQYWLPEVQVSTGKSESPVKTVYPAKPDIKEPDHKNTSVSDSKAEVLSSVRSTLIASNGASYSHEFSISGIRQEILLNQGGSSLKDFPEVPAFMFSSDRILSKPAGQILSNPSSVIRSGENVCLSKPVGVKLSSLKKATGEGSSPGDHASPVSLYRYEPGVYRIDFRLYSNPGISVQQAMAEAFNIIGSDACAYAVVLYVEGSERTEVANNVMKEIFSVLSQSPLPLVTVLKGQIASSGILLGLLSDVLLLDENSHYEYRREDLESVLNRAQQQTLLGLKLGPQNALHWISQGWKGTGAALQIHGLQVLPSAGLDNSLDVLIKSLTDKECYALRVLKQHLNQDLRETLKNNIGSVRTLKGLQEGLGEKSGIHRILSGEYIPANTNAAQSFGTPTEVLLDTDVMTLNVYPQGFVVVQMCDRESKNTFSDRFADGILKVFDHIRKNQHYKAIVLTGFDHYFACGGTREGLHKIQNKTITYKDLPIYDLPLMCDIPVIGAMQGHGIGAGWTLGMFTDLPIFSKESVYIVSMMKYGFTPGAGSTLVFPYKLGSDLGREVQYTAREYKGAELQKRGMVYPVLSRGQVLPFAMSVAAELCKASREELLLAKQIHARELRERIDSIYEQELKMHDLTFIGNDRVLERIREEFNVGMNDNTGQPSIQLLPGQRAKAETADAKAVSLPEICHTIGQLLAEELHMPAGEIRDDSNFLDMGMDSIVGVTWVKKVNARYGLNIQATKVYNHTTLRDFAEHVYAEGQKKGFFREIEEVPASGILAISQPAALKEEDRNIRKDKSSVIPQNEIMQRIQLMLAEELHMHPDEIDADSNFMDLGMDSIIGVTWVKKINQVYGLTVPATKVYNYSTIRNFAAYIQAEGQKLGLSDAGIEMKQVTMNRSVSVKPVQAAASGSEKSVENRLSDKILSDEVLQKLRVLLAEELHLSPEEISDKVSFLDMGMDSITGVTWVKRINATFKLSLQATQIYKYTTLFDFSAYLLEEGRKQGMFSATVLSAVSQEPETADKTTETAPDLPADVLEQSKENKTAFSYRAGRNRTDEIAIIGISGRFPRSGNVEEFWELIRKKGDGITEVPEHRWDMEAYYDTDQHAPGKTYSRWMGALDDVDRFDPLFFNISPAEAQCMDPQQRLFLEESWACIEDAGYSPEVLSGTKCGVFAGCVQGDYGQDQPELMRNAQGLIGRNAAILPARISYLLNLQGPSVAIDTSCSSSLTAIAEACNSLILGDCDLALAGGVYIMSGPSMHIMTSKAGMLSRDGRCFTFDNRANGFVPGEGVGVLLLKRLSDAERDGDTICGIVRGWGVNQDGKSNGLTAPNQDAQVRLEKEVYEKAGISPADIQLVEAHGTGTRLGDPIEFEALTQAFQAYTDRKQYCALGSVKSNIGHLLTAAGVAGVIKVILALRHRVLPPTIHFEKLNEHIDLENSPFFINTECREWKTEQGKRRCAAVSSFGVSGTNAHVVIEEYLPSLSAAGKHDFKGPVAVVLSARDADRLKAYATKLLHFIRKSPDLDLHALAYTLQTGRASMEERLGIVAITLDELSDKLQNFINGDAGNCFTGRAKRGNDSLAALGIDEELKTAAVMQWIRQKNYSSLLNGWVKGLAVNWNLLYDNKKPARISAPSYPFARERYWLPEVTPKEISAIHSRKAVVERIHPLIDKNESTLAVQKFSKELFRHEYYLRDHVILGEYVLPGVAHLEMALAAAEYAAEGQVISLYDIIWGKKVVAEETGKVINISLHPLKKDDLEYVIFSGNEKEAITYSRGKILLGKRSGSARILSVQEIEAIKSRCRVKKVKSEIYPWLSERNFYFGPTFQLTEELYCGENEAFSRLALPSAMESSLKEYTLQTSLLDAALRTFLGIWNKDQQELDLRVPFSLEELTVFHSIPETCYCHATVNRIGSDGTLSSNISVFTREGVEVVRAKGLVAKHLTTSEKKVHRSVSDFAVQTEMSDAAAGIMPGLHEKDALLAGTAAYLKKVLSQVTQLPETKIDKDTELEHYGIDSIMIMSLNRVLGKDFAALPGTLFFEYRTIHELTEYFIKNHEGRLMEMLSGSDLVKDHVIENIQDGGKTDRPFSRFIPSGESRSSAEEAGKENTDAVAIIGISGHYPQASGLDEFWNNLQSGRDCIEEIPLHRWDYRKFYDPVRKPGKTNCKWGGFIEDIDKFDAGFFNMTAEQAILADPQTRLFLQTAWEAMEDAGYTRQTICRDKERKAGVYIGLMWNEYQLYSKDERIVLANNAFLANQTSYFFDFHGPSLVIDTGCSSSLHAISMACESIRKGISPVALAGGVNLSIHPNKYIGLSHAGLLSSEGRCRSFGKGGNGQVPGEGVGCIVLKPLSKAIEDKDHIYGIIRSCVTNHGGKTNGITVPNPNAQADLISRAIEEAGISPEQISYIEAHGTGTEFGDPIEVRAMTKAFEKYTSKKQFCAIGSVKSNVGHLEGAAGIVAVTKVLLQMKHGKIAPSLHSGVLNPMIDFADTPFKVQQELTDWKRPLLEIDGKMQELPRMAGISSFGAGGSNAHLILEEYLPAGKEYAATEQKAVVVVLSAKNEDRLREYAQRLMNFVKQSPEVSGTRLPEIAFTLQTGREAMDERLGVVVTSAEELTEKLGHFLEGRGGPETGIFHHNVRQNKEFSRNALSLSEMESYIRNRDYDGLLKLWIQGYAVDWNLIYEDIKPDRVSVPTYPFAKERYWLEESPESEKEALRPAQEVLQDKRLYKDLVNEDKDAFDHVFDRLLNEGLSLNDAVYEIKFNLEKYSN
jgi:acyl transferase domain-containing protein/acyl carrier protein/enoyl-CoA hydratase/carnithine racemase